MEPIHPALRDELKSVYPGLTDADIDQYEELTSQRFNLDPSTSAQEIREIDARRARLVRAKMPALGDLHNAFTARARKASRPTKAPPRVEIRTPEDHPPSA